MKTLKITTDFHISTDHEKALIRMFEVKGLKLDVSLCQDKSLEGIVSPVTVPNRDLIGITLEIAATLVGLEEINIS